MRIKQPVKSLLSNTVQAVTGLAAVIAVFLFLSIVGMAVMLIVDLVVLLIFVLLAAVTLLVPVAVLVLIVWAVLEEMTE